MSASYWLENLFFSERVESPVPLGWLDPAVIFPRRFERMDESQQRAIACHELLHVARRDWLMNLLEELVLALFWFHPAIWWVVRSIRLSREQVVDGEVVALTGARKPYLHALLEIAGMPRATPVPAHGSAWPRCILEPIGTTQIVTRSRRSTRPPGSRRGMPL